MEVFAKKLLPLANVCRGVPIEVSKLNEYLESINGLIAADEIHNTSDGIKAKLKQLREAAFLIEDVLDEYQIFEEQQPGDPGCAALLCEPAEFIKTLIFRLRISYKIQDIESRVREFDESRTFDVFQIPSSLEERSSSSTVSQNFTRSSHREFDERRTFDDFQIQSPLEEISAVSQNYTRPSLREFDERKTFDDFQIQSSLEERSSSSTGSQNVTRPSLPMNARYDEEGGVVGFEAPTKELINWLLEGRAERTVIAVVGMGGVGKTTLAKTVYYKDRVIDEFDCQAWITVSGVYTVEGLLKDMLKQLCEGKREAPPKGISKLGGYSLIEEVRNYLREKRYVIFFDDVWNINFWSQIEFAVLDNKKRSRIVITTRINEVAQYCKESSFVHIQNLQPLRSEESQKLFCKNVFLNEPGEPCPEELKEISSKIVAKCDGLPLAIVVIGSIFSQMERTLSEWQKMYQRLHPELEKTDITNILKFSYDSLPYYLKPCYLYFGIYPGDYEVESTKLIKQWIAEGFVKYEKEKILEEVAEQYLEELINRSLVQVSSFSIDGKPKRFCVHPLLHDMILYKIKDCSFCHFVKDDESVSSGMIRRLRIATNSNNLMANIEGTHIRSLYIFIEEELPEDFVRIIPTKYKLLKVLDFEFSSVSHVPEKLGNLIHLRYLSFRGTNIETLPNSIGNLQFLETLDLRQTCVRQMPREINNLRKLRHLLANHTSWGSDYGIQMMEGVGGLVSLQTLRQVETDHRGVKLIEELEKLKELRLLGLIHVKGEYISTLCASINKMQHLEKLHIEAINFDEVIDLDSISPLPVLQKLCLRGKLERLPEWIPKLQKLVKLSLKSSKLTDESLKSVKELPNLLSLSLDSAYEGESLHFQDGGFQKLKKLSLRYLQSLNSIIVGENALPLLQEFKLEYIPLLKEVPSGIHHLGKLEVFHITDMPEEFRSRIQEVQGINNCVLQENITD